MVLLHDGLVFGVLMWLLGALIGWVARDGVNKKALRDSFLKGKIDGYYEAAMLQVEPEESPSLKRVK